MSDRIDLLSLHARELSGLGDGWHVYRWEALDGPDQPSMLTGAVAPLLTRGKNKGLPNFRAMDRNTERRIVITRSAHNAYRAAWSERTGKCAECVGIGTIVSGWSLADGARYKECPDCHGTGKRKGGEHG